MSRKNHSRKQQPQGKRKNKEKKVLPVFEGTVQMTREGFGFVIVPGEEDDIYVRKNHMCGALNGDTVLVAVTHAKTEHSRREGTVKEILVRSRKPFVGILHTIGEHSWVLMQSKVMPYDIQVANLDEFPAAESGMKVSAVVDYWKRGDACPTGHLVDVLGMPGENDTEMHAILAEYGLPYRFEKAVEAEAETIPAEIGGSDLAGRRDFRATLTFTIDPADAKDFDDALSFRTLDNGNFEVGVHIADVTWYVRPGMLMDDEAQSRGTSVYLVDRTVPMLPEKLSNRLCSLRPNEDKLTFSAVFELSPDAKIVNQWFGRTVIRSDYRFAYETAQQIIDAGEEAMKTELRGGTDGVNAALADPKIGSDAAMGEGITSGNIIPDRLKSAILTLNGLAAKLRKKRFAAGAISFERPEMKVLVDEKGRPVDVYQKISREANWLVEEFMLLANRCVAEFVTRKCKGKTFVYRVHDEPDRTKIESLREFVGNFGYKMGATNSGKEVSKALNGLFAAARETPEFNAIELLSLRSMAKARYDVDNIGHYGLAFKYYTHFTSPIRRYPDMMVHRLLAHYLDGGEGASKEKYQTLCKKCSERECVAADAERSSIKYKLVEFMQDKLGYEFDGHISGLTEWGMYVEVEPTKIEGMIALRDIRTDFLEFDEKHYRLVGRHSHRVYNLGDAVRVRVKKANLEQKQLDYELIDTEAESHGESRGASRGGVRKEARRESHGESQKETRGESRGESQKEDGRRERSRNTSGNSRRSAAKGYSGENGKSAGKDAGKAPKSESPKKSTTSRKTSASKKGKPATE